MGAGNKDLILGGRDIIVRSESGPFSCIIDCQNSGIGFIIEMGETNAAIIWGFTITHGQNSSGYGNNAGAINIEDASPTIRNCRLIDNDAAWDGGGICALNSNAVIEKCWIEGNSSPHSGGGISIPYSSNVIVRHCVIKNNSSSFLGQGILVYYSQALIEDCVIDNNSGGGGTGITDYGSSAIIRDCVVMNQLTGISFTSSAGMEVGYNDFWRNEVNFSSNAPAGIGTISGVNYNGDPCDCYSNVFLDPQFQSLMGSNAYKLLPNSPMIDAGDPQGPWDPDNTRSDIGARHFYQSGALESDEWDEIPVPSKNVIDSISPNPFNPETNIEFSVAQASMVNLTVYDIAGRIAAELVEGQYAPGNYSVKFDGRGLASGIYFAKIECGGSVNVKKMMLVK